MLPRQRERFLAEVADLACCREISDVDDERVEAGPPLGGVDGGDGSGVRGVGGQAIDRLGRQNDEAAAAKRGDGPVQIAQSWASM